MTERAQIVAAIAVLDWLAANEAARSETEPNKTVMEPNAPTRNESVRT